MRFYYHLYDLLDADSRLLFMIFYRFRLPVTFVRDRHVALLLAMTIKGIPFFLRWHREPLSKQRHTWWLWVEIATPPAGARNDTLGRHFHSNDILVSFT